MKIYVGNLPFDAKEDELKSLFEQYGQVSSAAVVTDRETGRSKGFGFVEMDDESQGRAAIAGLADKDLRGRKLRVDEARAAAPSDRPRPGGGRGGRPPRPRRS